MRKRTAAIVLAAATALATPAVIVSATGPAQAAGQICENGGGGLCLNDWNGAGSGGAVKMGQNGWTHQNFGNYQLTTMCGAGRVTHSCPFTNTSLDNALFDSIIVAVQYQGNPSLCVGTSQTTRGAILVACPQRNGTGGGWGSVQVERQNVNNCFAQNGDTQLMNRLWSDHDATVANLTGSTATGNQAAMFNQTNPAIVCWGTG